MSDQEAAFLCGPIPLSSVVLPGALLCSRRLAGCLTGPKDRRRPRGRHMCEGTGGGAAQGARR